ncbi:MAG: tetratricopeptide repeat protein [Desulfofustis sp. PB-SRB1]|nr:tetratricopeptide repeat protein [Desulfofustis sp. PB-SRB1]MBM1002320.1 tetratricopeptide repeat protein [Desulfofustis sp. PB-SRB1]HBH29023.1 hypothetical protein [Desulfofustis sp.]
MIQLNLFDLHIIASAQGFACLARFEFDEARSHFTKALDIRPEYTEAQRGINDVVYWQKAIEGIGGDTSPASVGHLWRMFCGFDFLESQHHRNLRQHLLKFLATLLPDHPSFYDPPDLCHGYLHLLRGDYQRAEANLRLLVEHYPDTALLHLFLAEALWQQGRGEPAGPQYARALLLDPAACENRKISNYPLMEIITEYGADQAPIYGFFKGVLPLVKLPGRLLPDTSANMLYETMRKAEQARRRRAHQQMISHRKELQRANKTVFGDYLDYVRGSIGPD